VAVRMKGDVRDYYIANDLQPQGSQYGYLDTNGKSVELIVPTDGAGLVEWRGGAGTTWQVTLIAFIGNLAPTIDSEAPAGGAERLDVDISFSCHDDADVAPLTMDIDLTDPLAVVHNSMINGVWQLGYNGDVDGNATKGFGVVLDTHPDFMPGLWTVDVYVEDFPGLSATSSWTFTVDSMAVVEVIQSSINSIDITFDEEPLHLDPSGDEDGVNLSLYSLSGPAAPNPVRLLQIAEYIGSNTIRLYTDGPLVPGQSYTMGYGGITAVSGAMLWPTTGSATWTAFGADESPAPARLERSRWDIRNPQTSRDAGGVELGTMAVDEEGDVDVETGRAYLRKRIMRRLSTSKGAFAHLPNYGIELNTKELCRPAQLRRLQQDVEAQVAEEPDVVSVRAAVSSPSPGIVWVRLKVRDSLGEFTMEMTLGDE